MRRKTITSGFGAALLLAPAAIARVSENQPTAVAAEPSMLGRFRADIKHSAELSRETAKALLRLGAVAMLFAASNSSLAQVSEVDSYERAVISQTKEDALAFIENFRSSHLTGDLIESLRPEVAREVCADLPGDVSRAQRACEQLQKVPVAEATASARDAASSTEQSTTTAAPTQPIETQSTGGMETAPASTGAVAAAPPVVALEGEGQSKTSTAAGVGGTTDSAVAAAESAASSSVLPQSAATPTPIKSRPAVYVGP